MLGMLHEKHAVQRGIAVPTEKTHGNTVIEICLNNILKMQYIPHTEHCASNTKTNWFVLKVLKPTDT